MSRRRLAVETAALWVEPVVDLHEKDVVGARCEERGAITVECEVADGLESGAALLPRDVHRRSFAPLPPQHRVATQGTQVEIEIWDRPAVGHEVEGLRRHELLGAAIVS